jgi:hypothetical protein
MALAASVPVLPNQEKKTELQNRPIHLLTLYIHRIKLFKNHKWHHFAEKKTPHSAQTDAHQQVSVPSRAEVTPTKNSSPHISTPQYKHCEEQSIGGLSCLPSATAHTHLHTLGLQFIQDPG